MEAFLKRLGILLVAGFFFDDHRPELLNPRVQPHHQVFHLYIALWVLFDMREISEKTNPKRDFGVITSFFEPRCLLPLRVVQA